MLQNHYILPFLNNNPTQKAAVSAIGMLPTNGLHVPTLIEIDRTCDARERALIGVLPNDRPNRGMCQLHDLLAACPTREPREETRSLRLDPAKEAGGGLLKRIPSRPIRTPRGGWLDIVLPEADVAIEDGGSAVFSLATLHKGLYLPAILSYVGNLAPIGFKIEHGDKVEVTPHHTAEMLELLDAIFAIAKEVISAHLEAMLACLTHVSQVAVIVELSALCGLDVNELHLLTASQCLPVDLRLIMRDIDAHSTRIAGAQIGQRSHKGDEERCSQCDEHLAPQVPRRLVSARLAGALGCRFASSGIFGHERGIRKSALHVLYLKKEVADGDIEEVGQHHHGVDAKVALAILDV